MAEKTGFSIVTYKLRLYNRHYDWMLITKQIYNQVVWHYYQILMSNRSLLEQNNFLLLRELERLSVGTKEMRKKEEEPVWKLEHLPKIPIYFRRAAINAAIGLARSYDTSCKIWEKEKQSGVMRERGFPSPAGKMDISPVFYKGMYRDFQTDSIQLKVYNGEKWVWVLFPYVGRQIPFMEKVLSPVLKVEKKEVFLHVPVKVSAGEILTVRERIERESFIAAVSFPDSDSLAVCAVLNQEGQLLDSCFFHGGKARGAQRRKVQIRLEKSKKSRKGNRRRMDEERENAALYQKLEQINQYYAHKISREILNYCKRYPVSVIVVPNYGNTISFQEKRYLRTNAYCWQGRAIIRNLKYKAWKEGILVTVIPPYHISDCCSECGRKIQRYNEGHKASRNYYGGQLFLCPNGHRGNTALNTAKNIGRYFLRHFQEDSVQEKEEKMAE